MTSQTMGSALQAAKVEFGDDKEPLIQVRYTGEGSGTLAVDADGASSKLRITLVGNGTTTNVDGETDTTVAAVIDAINAVAGFEARRYNGASDLSTDSNDFIDTTAFDVPRTWTNALYRDASEHNVWTKRLSNPETDKNGRIQIQAIRGSVSGTGALTLKLFADQSGETAQEVWSYVGTITSAAATEFLNLDVDATYEYRGPVRIEAEAATDLTGVDLIVNYRPVN